MEQKYNKITLYKEINETKKNKVKETKKSKIKKLG